MIDLSNIRISSPNKATKLTASEIKQVSNFEGKSHLLGFQWYIPKIHFIHFVDDSRIVPVN